jgi:hypothetical protein
MSFNALISNVTKKFENLTSQIPEIGANIRAGLEKTMNDFKAEANINIPKIPGLSIPGENFASMTPEQFKSNLPAKPGPISFTSKAGSLVPGVSAPPWPNELEPFASYNCIITLACLSPKEVNDPNNTFRKSGLQTVVLRSGGTAGAREKQKTRIEEALGANVEFFIKDFEFDSVMAPNSRGRTSNAAKFSFSVQEPYSMGLFFQALKVAAASCGYDDYTLAPFCFQLDFKGYNVDGEVQDVPYARRMIPVKLTTGEFSVNEGGSEYSMTAIGWNDAALTDSVTQIKTDLALKGRTVREIIQTGGEGLTEFMNKRLQELAGKDQIVTPDQYVVVFPTDTSSENSGLDAFGGSGEDVGSATVSPGMDFYDPSGVQYTGAHLEEFYKSIVGSQATEVPSTFNEYFSALANNADNAKEIEFMFKKYAGSDYSNNKVANSKIVGDPVEAGIQPMNPANFANDPRGGFAEQDRANAQAEANAATNTARNEFRSQYEIFNRSNRNLQISDDIRVFKFKAGTKIPEIIEEVIITSEYGRGLVDQLTDLKDPQGMIDWFRIETDTYIIPDDKELKRSGNYPQLYVYRVVPYKVHHSVFANPKDPSVGLAELKGQVAKQYNYIYTGKNKDILDFQIQYNYAFIRPIPADRGSNPANTAQGASNQTRAGAPDVQYTTGSGGSGSSGSDSDDGGSTKEVIGNSTGGQSAGLDNSSIGIARQFNDRLMHSNTDLLQVEMTIMGDPFYMSDSGLGNYHAKDTSYTNMNADGHMNHTNGQVHINLMFRTPVDLNPLDGSYIFPEDLIVVDQYSGVYYIPKVVHRIQENQFTQTLTMLRLPNQYQNEGRSNIGALVPVTDPTKAINDKAVAFSNKVSEAASTLGAEPGYEEYLKAVQEILPGFNSLNAVIQSQKKNLDSRALEAFGRISDALVGAQAALDAGNLAKIGMDFQSMIGASATIQDITSSIDGRLENTLNQLGLDGQNVLGAIGTATNNAVSELSRVQVDIPNAIEQAATDSAAAIRALNERLK